MLRYDEARQLHTVQLPLRSYGARGASTWSHDVCLESCMIPLSVCNVLVLLVKRKLLFWRRINNDSGGAYLHDRKVEMCIEISDF